jgi:hypothetical protein
MQVSAPAYCILSFTPHTSHPSRYIFSLTFHLSYHITSSLPLPPLSHYLLSPTTSSLPLPPLSHYLLSPTTSSLPLPPLSHYLFSLLIPYPYFSSLLCPSRRCIQARERSLNYEKARECGGIRREETTRCVVCCVLFVSIIV